MTELSTLFGDLVRLGMDLSTEADSRLRAELALPLSWYETMAVIGRVPDCRVFDIVAELGLTVGGVSKIVDRLEAANYCSRAANPNDRRSSYITLTALGADRTGRARIVVEQLTASRLNGILTVRAVDQMASYVHRLRTEGLVAEGAAVSA